MESNKRHEIEKIVDFVRKETPQTEQLLLNAINALALFLENEQRVTDSKIIDLVSERNYPKATEYMNMSQLIADINKVFGNMVGNIHIENSMKLTGVDIQEEKAEDLEEEDPEMDGATDDKINYEKYRVDENISYDIMKDFRYTKPAAFSLDGEKISARQWKLLLLYTCKLLYEKNPNLFREFINDKFMQGKTRTYFSKSSMGMAKPERIENTDIYVETNLSANGVRDLIVRMLERYRMPFAAYRIFLSKDLTTLHTNETQGATQIYEQEDENEQDVTCKDFDYKTGKCMNKKSPLFIMECNHKKNCPYIEKTKIYYLPKKILNVKACPICNSEMERTTFPVKYFLSNQEKAYSLNGYRCVGCNQAFINEELYKNFTKSKDENMLNLSFQEWKV